MTAAEGKSMGSRRIAVTVGFIAASAAMAVFAEAPAFARPFDPDVVRVRERLRQRFVRTPHRTWDVRTRATLRASVVAAFPDVAAAGRDEDTVLRFRSADFEFESRLGEARRFRPGARRLVFRARPSEGAAVRVRARFWTLPAGGTHVQMRLRATGVSLVSDAERGGETGMRRLPLVAAARIDGDTVHYAGDGFAEVASRTVEVLGDPVTLTAVDYSARGLPVDDAADANAPTLDVTTPSDSAVISGAAVAVTGVVRDDQSLASITMSLNGSAPVGLDFAARDGTAGLGSVEADFSAPLAPAIGTNSLSVVVRDAAGNTAQRTVTFVYSEPRTVSVAVGPSHTLFVVDGALFGCGRNAFGQCGDGTQIAKSRPTPVSGVSDARAVAAGGNHSLVLLADGTLLAMGDNQFGQVGDGTREMRTSPTPVTGLESGVVAVAASVHHSVAVKADGTVWAWGNDDLKAFGASSIDVPMQVGIVEGATEVATGVYHAVIVAGDGGVWALGQNVYGQVGTSGPAYPTIATQVPGVSGVASVAAGAYHTLARHSDGTVSGWGQNGALVLGSDNRDQRTPVAVPDLAGVTGMTSGYFYALFLDSDGSLFARGNIGQLVGPTGDFATDTLPTTAPFDVLDQVVGAWASDHHAILQRGDGTLWAVGWNNWGQFGNGTTSNEFTTDVTRVLLPE